MYQYGVSMGYEYPGNVHRVCKCHRVPIGPVRVLYSPEHETAHYGGLVICGSPWACPVCAAKIGERRRAEVAEAFDYAYHTLQGKKVVMVTLTFPHTAWQDLKEMLRQQADALRRLRAGEPWRRIKKRIGYSGLIRSLEITHGDNGWHPHTHEAWIVDRDADADELRESIVQRWAASCRRAGLLDSKSEADFRRHAVHVLDWASESNYLQKQDDCHWGADRELASGRTKRSKGRAPFDLLDDIAEGDHQAKRLFQDYVMATKGKAQMFWSKGLKAAVGIDEKTDEELAAEPEEDAEVIAVFDSTQWNHVLAAAAQSDILDEAEEGGWQAIADWFEYHGLSPPGRPRPPD